MATQKVPGKQNGMGLGATSRGRLDTCHPDIRRVVELAAGRYPLTVLCGHRPENEQNAAYQTGASQVKWPNSRHNSSPSEAVDLSPWPIDWKAEARFREMAAVVLAAAKELGIELEWGGNWKKFRDMPHFELVRKK